MDVSDGFLNKLSNYFYLKLFLLVAGFEPSILGLWVESSATVVGLLARQIYLLIGWVENDITFSLLTCLVQWLGEHQQSTYVLCIETVVYT